MDTSFLEKKISNLHFSVLPTATKRAFLLFAKTQWLKIGGWYLAGGTALALQGGHRSSVDLDFFTTRKNFDIAKLEQTLVSLGQWRTDRTAKGTLYGKFFGAKTSFIAYPFFKPSVKKNVYGCVKMLTADDIAVMKIIAISQRKL